MRPTLKARDILRAAAARLRETDPVYRSLDGEELHPNQQPARVMAAQKNVPEAQQ